MSKSPLSGPWLEHRQAFRPEVGRCSLGESLFICSSKAGLWFQGFIVERQREREKVERGKENSHGHVERGGKGKREGGLESKKGESLKRVSRGQAAPFIVGWAILLLPGNCGEETRQNARSLGLCLCD